MSDFRIIPSIDELRQRSTVRALEARFGADATVDALRHAAAQRVAVRVGRRDGGLVLEVADDGVGFDPADPELRSRRLGLTSMEERARRLGGRLEIRPAPGAGTTVRLEVGGG